MPRGGRRPGAGRPKGTGHKLKSTMDKEAAREALRALVKESLRPMVEAQVANARGLKYLVVRDRKSGKFVRVTEAMARAREGKIGQDEEVIEVWEKDPSIAAFTDLMDRTLDKAVQPVKGELEHTVRVYKWQE